jgi:hypothetical protein
MHSKWPSDSIIEVSYLDTFKVTKRLNYRSYTLYVVLVSICIKLTRLTLISELILRHYRKSTMNNKRKWWFWKIKLTYLNISLLHWNSWKLLINYSPLRHYKKGTNCGFRPRDSIIEVSYLDTFKVTKWLNYRSYTLYVVLVYLGSILM